MKTTAVLSMLATMTCTFGLALTGCAVDTFENAEMASGSDALSLAEQKLAEPDARMLRAYLEERGFAIDLENIDQPRVGSTPMVAIPFVKADGSTAQLVVALEGNQQTRTTMVSIPIGSGLQDSIHTVVDGQIVDKQSVMSAGSEQPDGCCMYELAVLCWMSCLGDPDPCCAPNCCCPGGCTNSGFWGD